MIYLFPALALTVLLVGCPDAKQPHVPPRVPTPKADDAVVQTLGPALATQGQDLSRQKIIGL
jgi:hypothetical protein